MPRLYDFEIVSNLSNNDHPILEKDFIHMYSKYHSHLQQCIENIHVSSTQMKFIKVYIGNNVEHSNTMNEENTTMNITTTNTTTLNHEFEHHPHPHHKTCIGIIPITINSGHIHHQDGYNIFTLSPYHHYISYGRAELYINDHEINKYIIYGVERVIDLFSKLLEYTKLDQVIIIGNLMLSTNLYDGDLYSRLDMYRELTCYLIAQYPQHVLMMRSLSIYSTILQTLNDIGYQSIPSRMIYVLNCHVNEHGNDQLFLKKRDVKDDRKLLSKFTKQVYDIYSNQDLLKVIENYDDTHNSKNDDHQISYHPWIHQIVDIYNMLYIGKYSECNIKFTPTFIYETLSNNIIQYKCLYNRETQCIDGVIGYFIKSFPRNAIQHVPLLRNVTSATISSHGSSSSRMHDMNGTTTLNTTNTTSHDMNGTTTLNTKNTKNTKNTTLNTTLNTTTNPITTSKNTSNIRIMTCPILGYRTTLDQKSIPLYRLLSALLLKQAQQENAFFNQSSGASKFKMNRGCVPCVEYSAFYNRHVSFMRRLPWNVLRFLLNVIAKPIMEYYQL